MRKHRNNDTPKSGPSVRDIIVVILSIAALAGLVGIVLVSNANEQRLEQALSATRDTLEETPAEPVEPASVCINEVSAQGWIELYNDNTAAVSLAGYTLWLNGTQVWAFGQGDTLEPEAFCAAALGDGFHSGGENVVALHGADGVAAGQLLLPALNGAESYARLEDGGTAFALLAGTRGATNAGAATVPPRGLAFSVPGGFYDTELLLELWAPEGCEVYYTTDGSAPGSASAKYEAPIAIQPVAGSGYRYAASKGIEYDHQYRPESIHMGTVVRAIAMDGGTQVGEEQTQSYFIALNALGAYAGFPALSITAQPESLFDYFEGIYVSGRAHEDSLARGGDGGGIANYTQGWEKPAHIEYFEPAKGKTYAGDVSLGIRQDSAVTSPQKSFLLRLEEAVSQGSSLHGFPQEDTQTLELATFGKDNYYKLRELAACDLLQGSAAGVQQVQPCNVFVNGEFWGTYLLRRPWSAKTLEAAYGVPADALVVARGGVVDGDGEDQPLYDALLAFALENDMADAERFGRLQEQMDMDSYLDYLCANIYLANADYGKTPAVLWRSREAGGDAYGDGRWRWLMPDLANAMANGMEGEVCSSSIDTFLQPEVVQDALFRALLESPQFCQMLEDNMARMEREVFAPERAQESISRCVKEMNQAALNSYKRFFGVAADTFVADEAEKMTAFFNERGAYIRRYTREVVEGTAPWGTPEEAESSAETGGEDTGADSADSEAAKAAESAETAEGADTNTDTENAYTGAEAADTSKPAGAPASGAAP